MSDNTSVPYQSIQKAINTMLSGHITGSIYDEVPMDPAYPHTILGEPTDGPFEARGVKGRMVVWPFTVWSRDAGGKFECYGIMAAIVEHLTESKLTMTGWSEVWKTFQTGTVGRVEKQPVPTWAGTVTMLICVVKNT